MASTGGNTTRSLHGCWTCRVRKKKCPENRPFCSTCVSLKIECHGYGEKPVWMDSGPLQKEQALALKRRISQSKRRRRTRRILETVSPPRDQNQEAGILCGEASQNSESVSTDSSDQIQLIEGDWDLEVFDDSLLQIWSPDLGMELMDGSLINGINQDSALAAGTFPEYTVDTNIGWLGNEPQGGSSSKAAVLRPGTMSFQECDKSIPRLDAQPDINLSPVHIPLEDSIRCGSEMPANSEKDLAQRPCTTSSSSSTESPCDLNNLLVKVPFREAIEDTLTIKYLDEVFYMQYPFYNTPCRQDRGWLFSAMTRVQSIRYATLALSEFAIQAETTPQGLTAQILPKTSDYYDLALRVAKLDGRVGDKFGIAGLAMNMERIFCSLQILFCQLFGGGTSTWRQDFQKAARLVPSVVQEMLQQTKIVHGKHEQDLTASEASTVALGIDTGTKLILGSIVWLDILWSASTRSPLSPDLDHRKILNAFKIELGGLFGCTSSVALILHDIVHLDNWKRTTERARKLSMAELVKRGAEIETLLHQEIAQLEALSSCKLTASQVDISSIFARSALTYLHNVISGAHPEMPEIEESVSLTLSAFRSLRDPKLLQSLVWPFCVTGCLAVESQQPIFRELIEKAGITTLGGRSYLEAVGIIEQCWEMRRTCYHSCDWAFIMNRRGHGSVLL